MVPPELGHPLARMVHFNHDAEMENLNTEKFLRLFQIQHLLCQESYVNSNKVKNKISYLFAENKTKQSIARTFL